MVDEVADVRHGRTNDGGGGKESEGEVNPSRAEMKEPEANADRDARPSASAVGGPDIPTLS